MFCPTRLPKSVLSSDRSCLFAVFVEPVLPSILPAPRKSSYFAIKPPRYSFYGTPTATRMVRYHSAHNLRLGDVQRDVQYDEHEPAAPMLPDYSSNERFSVVDVSTESVVVIVECIMPALSPQSPDMARFYTSRLLVIKRHLLPVARACIYSYFSH